MPNSRYKLSKLAQAHLRKIKNYTVTNFSEVQWQNYKNKLLIGFQMLADTPTVGKSCHDLYPNGFYFPVGKHVAYFNKKEDFILIVAVLGKSQLPQNHFK
ncbi:type II toxin-antitoxin system RelE/ParE family toxin [Vibrio sp. S11_S32]|uniref:type II toxin-antitoxin system RelE/ParE family toxin n=1 Tax=Vibrio sp. S11_S32 TaxID=2720225 RepID=UPI0016802567|nr:type II toxin-antitoxin system RelE/ParE family toxin [Vibrio sp. S11_S32]MBD1577402.1 type II toxin-antitoxin system RelE/ParE family toxin [Vibrio sp. S11_S32]